MTRLILGPLRPLSAGCAARIYTAFFRAVFVPNWRFRPGIPARYFGLHAQAEGKNQVGNLDGVRARFGESYIAEPDVIAGQLSADSAAQAADTVLVTVPKQLGVDFIARLLESILNEWKVCLRCSGQHRLKG